MASLQAHLLVWLLKWRIKHRLRNVADVATARNAFPALAATIPPALRVVQHTVGGVPAEWVVSERGTDALTLIYLHGGGYFACSPRTHRAITTWFAIQGFRVCVPEYRLAPEHPFPAAVQDAVAVYRGLLETGHAPARIAIAGESAGGGLALALLLALRDAGIALPAAVAVFSPWTDLACTGASLRENSRRDAMFRGEQVAHASDVYLGGADPCAPLASPLYADWHGMPPMLIHVGRDEVLRDDSLRLADRARAARVDIELKIWPVVPHGWQLLHQVLPEARRSLGEAANFLRARMARGQVC
jgi:acetyl esterase/lipase